MKTGTFMKLVLLIAALAVATVEHNLTASAETRPPWLKECVFDSQGNLVSYTCNYIEKDEVCSAYNC
jgi:hypothetical protein